MHFLRPVFLVLALMLGHTIFCTTPEASDLKVRFFKRNAIFTASSMGIGFFGQNIIQEFQNHSLDKGHAKYLSLGKWAVPAAICLAVAAARPLKIDCDTTEKDSFYRHLLPFPAAGTGYFISKLLHDSHSRSAQVLLGVTKTGTL